MRPWLSILVLSAATAPGLAVEFNRDIRPLLSDKCFICHGPDEARRKAGLRLDLRESALAPAKSGRAAIVPGHPETSELLARLAHADPDERMPPPEKGPALSAAEIQLLRDWIAAGAVYKPHWAFVPPTRAPAPPGGDIDGWINAALDGAGLAAEPAADPATLLRRATLDLTGLPPTLAEIDAFLADTQPAAYERALDRLLASPHYGERMAVEWLDAARYADTNGFQTDETRDMSAWRDWVIRAFNTNLPFDRFTLEQLAGDLLPNPTRDQVLATGFHRNHRLNTEGGSIAEEFLVENVADRVLTTGAVWLGLTLDCARCHDHKYDPISQNDYYRFFAFFNTIDETGLGDRDGGGARGKKGNTQPLLSLARPEDETRLADLRRQLAETEAELARLQNDDTGTGDETPGHPREPAAWDILRPESLEAKGAQLTLAEDGSITASGPLVPSEVYAAETVVRGAGFTALRLELLPDPATPKKSVGRAENGNAVISEVEVRWLRTFDDDQWKPLRIRASSADFSQDTRDVAGAHDGKTDTAWSVLPQVGQEHAAVFEFDAPVGDPAGIRLEVRLRHELPVGAKAATARFRLSVTRNPSPHVVPRDIAAILEKAPGKRSADERKRLAAHTRARSPALRKAEERKGRLDKQLAAAERALPSTMVMREMEKPRDTFVLARGQYDQPREKVTPGVPGFLPPLPAGAPANRLGLAQWMMDPKNPLVARVTVNRLWKMLFGQGLVASVENFGAQAEPPSHPELLDALAVSFVAGGWDVKALLRRMMTSAAYRRAARTTPQALEIDPANRLLARAARPRLAAEFLRDQALVLGGLLNPSVGGPAFKAYQPDGLWEELAGVDPALAAYERSRGPDLYRRSLYLFVKRTAPHPLLATFDAPSREVCVVARQRTSTPMQALQLLNDPTFVEAARGLGARMARAAIPDPAAGLAHGFRLATGRFPTADEAALLLRQFERQLTHARRDPAATARLLTIGDTPPPPDLPAPMLAAYANLASLLLNLDETVTRP